MQGEIHVHGVEAKHDPAVIGAVEQAGIEQRMHVAVPRLDVPPTRRVIGPVN